MFEGEKRKEERQSLEESAKGTLLFYTRHTSRNKMEDKHRKLRIKGWKRGQWLDMSMTLLFTRLWRNTLNQIFPTQAHKVPMLTLVPMVLMKAPIWDSSAMTYSWLKKLTLLRKSGLDSYLYWKFNEMQKRALCLSENSARSGFISLWIIIYTKPLAKS